MERPKDDIDDVTLYLMGMTEPPEVTLQAEADEDTKKTQGLQETDWSKVQY